MRNDEAVATEESTERSALLARTSRASERAQGGDGGGTLEGSSTPGPLPASASRLAGQRILLSTMFAMSGYMFGYFQSQLPVTKERLAVSDAHFGLLLLFDDFGCFCGQALTTTRFAKPLRRPSVAPWIGAVAVLSIAQANLATSAAPFGLALLLNGVTISLFDILINVQIVTLGTQSGQTEAPFFHGVMSAGQFLGSFLGMTFTRAHLQFDRQVWLTGLTLAFGFLIHWPFVLRLMGQDERSNGVVQQDPEEANDSAETTTGGPSSTLTKADRDHLSKFFLLLALLGGLSSVGEGGTPEWSGIYLRQNLHTSFDTSNTAALACAAGMAIARLAGSRIANLVGIEATIAGGTLFTAASMSLGLWSGSPLIFLVAVACTGAGLANVTPLSIAMLSKIPDSELQARAVTRLSIAQNIGFFTGPPFIGAISGAVGLRWALGGVVSLASLTISALSAAFLRRLSPS